MKMKTVLLIVLVLLAGITAFAQTQEGLSIEEYTRIIQRNPNDAEAYFYRGVAHIQSGNIDQAIADYTQSIRINPNIATAF